MGAGPEIGRVAVRALPDTAVFGWPLSRYVARAERSTRLHITVALAGDGLTEDASRLAAAVLTVPAEIDTTRAETEFHPPGNKQHGLDVLGHARRAGSCRPSNSRRPQLGSASRRSPGPSDHQHRAPRTGTAAHTKGVLIAPAGQIHKINLC